MVCTKHISGVSCPNLARDIALHVERSRNDNILCQEKYRFTIMENYHLRDKSLSLKAKGLLSQMLSLLEDWGYTLAGLSLINKESIDAIRTAIEYTIYEQPQPPQQSRKVNALVKKSCCNYDNGNCLLLDDGETARPCYAVGAK